MKASNNITLEEMMNLGMHFGHKKEKTHAAAKSFIFCVKEGISIINLEKTQESLQEARRVFEKFIKDGKKILFVGTKSQAKDLVKKVAEGLEAPYVTEKWLGGTLTNFETINATLKRMKELEDYSKSEKFKERTKRERTTLINKLNRMQLVFKGISEMKELPDVLFIVDPVKDDIALEEANKMDIPVMAICDTNCNPQKIDYPVFANDDAKSSITTILGYIAGVQLTEEKELKKEDESKGEEK